MNQRDEISVKSNAHAALSAPHDAAGPAQAIGWDDQREAVGNEQRRNDLKGGAGVGNAANRAVDHTAAETD